MLNIVSSETDPGKLNVSDLYWVSEVRVLGFGVTGYQGMGIRFGTTPPPLCLDTEIVYNNIEKITHIVVHVPKQQHFTSNNVENIL